MRFLFEQQQATNAAIQQLVAVTQQTQATLSAGFASASQPFTAGNSGSKSKSIIPDPDKFSGDRSKTQLWLLQLQRKFEVDAATYPNDRARVAFASALMTGPALTWLALYERQRPRPQFLDDWTLFQESVLQRFGEDDPQTQAVRNIEKLKQTGSCHKYYSDFTKYALETGYPDVVLKRLFYHGLKDSIKDSLSARVGSEPDSLELYAQLCITIDNRQHDREMEKKHASKPKPSSSQSSGKGNHAGPSSSSRNSHPSHQSRSTPQSDPMEIDSTKKHKKLTDAEKQRRRDNNLCLYCASPDHRRAECPLAPSNRNNKGKAPAHSVQPQKSEPGPSGSQ
jgi:hypothetical protein